MFYIRYKPAGYETIWKVVGPFAHKNREFRRTLARLQEIHSNVEVTEG